RVAKLTVLGRVMKGNGLNDFVRQAPKREYIRSQFGVRRAEHFSFGVDELDTFRGMEFLRGSVAVGQLARHHQTPDIVKQAGRLRLLTKIGITRCNQLSDPIGQNAYL